jgi:hypothetical protein
MDKTAGSSTEQAGVDTTHGQTAAPGGGAVARAVPHSPGSDRHERETRSVAMRDLRK